MFNQSCKYCRRYIKKEVNLRYVCRDCHKLVRFINRFDKLTLKNKVLLLKKGGVKSERDKDN